MLKRDRKQKFRLNLLDDWKDEFLAAKLFLQNKDILFQNEKDIKRERK